MRENEHIIMILPKDTSTETLDNIRNKYDFDLKIIDIYDDYLNDDEILLDVYEAGVVDTGLAKYDRYIDLYIDMDCFIYIHGFEEFMKEINKRNDWLLDAQKWSEIIKDLKYNFNISKIGLSTCSSLERITEICDDSHTKILISEMNAATLLNMRWLAFNFFE